MPGSHHETEIPLIIPVQVGYKDKGACMAIQFRGTYLCMECFSREVVRKASEEIAGTCIIKLINTVINPRIMRTL